MSQLLIAHIEGIIGVALGAILLLLLLLVRLCQRETPLLQRRLQWLLSICILLIGSANQLRNGPYDAIAAFFGIAGNVGCIAGGVLAIRGWLAGKSAV